jgi:hypothetical protein
MINSRKKRKTRKARKARKGGNRDKKYYTVGGEIKESFPDPGPEQCHPRVGNVRPEQGCIPQDILNEVATKLNVEPTRDAIEKKLGVSPKKEYSFVKALPLDESRKNELIKQYLRPKQPDEWKNDPDKWLNNLDIENVMKDYTEILSEFIFMGPYPIDFAAPDPTAGPASKKCLIQEICELNINNAIQQGKKYIGIIYNLDKHDESGSHWVATFTDLVKNKTYYFDSYGKTSSKIKGVEIPAQIQTFMRWLKEQNKDMELLYNGHRFQYGNSECGMYCLYFIIRMLAGDDITTFVRREPPDNYMLDLRDWLFST